MQGLDALAGLCRNLVAFVAYVLVEAHYQLLVVSLVVVKQVGLVEDEHDGDAIGFG